MRIIITSQLLEGVNEYKIKGRNHQTPLPTGLIFVPSCPPLCAHGTRSISFPTLSLPLGWTLCWCISQAELGYAAVTNSPDAQCPETAQFYFSFTLCIQHRLLLFCSASLWNPTGQPVWGILLVVMRKGKAEEFKKVLTFKASTQK